MLLTRTEMTYDFGGARFDTGADRDLLAFFFSQFLYGEMTGIQVGHWLYLAPDLDAAVFLARQSAEEMGHVRIFLETLRLIGAPAGPAHPIVRFLATGFMGGTFPEHTCLEMALGEGFVLMVLYALIDTLADPALVRALESTTVQEERHVAFGEERTLRAVRDNPRLRNHLLALSLVSLRAIRKFGPQIRQLAPAHPVVSQMPGFTQRVVEVTELRLRRMGLLDRPLAELGGLGGNLRMAGALARRYGRLIRPRRGRLLGTYLADPFVARAVKGQTSGEERSAEPETGAF